MKKKLTIYLVLVAICVILLVLFLSSSDSSSEVSTQASAIEAIIQEDNQEQIIMTQTNENNPVAIVSTNMGTITIELFQDITPNTVENFITLSNNNFYDGVRFHRVIEGFMIQGGDPLSKDDSMMNRWGTGGPGYTFPDEITEQNANVVGTISMANAGPNTNGSQFFINVADNVFLDDKHTVFGKVIEGYDVVEKISLVDTVPGIDRPIQDVVIERVEIK